MDRIALTVLVFFLLLTLVGQIRFIIKLLRKIKKYDKIANTLFLSEFVECCCYLANCSICTLDKSDSSCCQRSLDKNITEEEYEQRVKGTKIVEDLKKEELKIKNLIFDKKKVSLFWVSKATLIPIERIIEILSNDVNYSIKNDYIINQRFLEPDKSLDYKFVEGDIDIKEKERKIAEGICPFCDNLFPKGSEYCPNCGNYLLN